MSTRPRHHLPWLLRALAVASALALQTRLVHAEAPSIVVFEAQDTLSGLIVAELSALGFRVLSVEASEPPQTPAEAEAAARAAAAIAEVYVLATRSGVDVWSIDHVTGKSSSRHVSRADASGAADERVIAVRAVELLRASLLELELPDQTQSAPAKPNDPMVPQARPISPTTAAVPGLLLDVGFGASSNLGADGVSPILAASVFWQPAAQVGVGLSGLVPLARASVSEREGNASIATAQIAAGSRLYMLSGGPARASVGAGLGAVWFQVEGIGAGAEYSLASEQVLALAAHADVGVHWQLSPKFALSSRLGASHAFARPVVQFAGRHVLTLGRPLVAWTLGIEYRAFGDSGGD